MNEIPAVDWLLNKTIDMKRGQVRFVKLNGQKCFYNLQNAPFCSLDPFCSLNGHHQWGYLDDKYPGVYPEMELHSATADQTTACH